MDEETKREASRSNLFTVCLSLRELCEKRRREMGQLDESSAARRNQTLYFHCKVLPLLASMMSMSVMSMSVMSMMSMMSVMSMTMMSVLKSSIVPVAMFESVTLESMLMSSMVPFSEAFVSLMEGRALNEGGKKTESKKKQ